LPGDPGTFRGFGRDRERRTETAATKVVERRFRDQS
jgi:hypothetical protein